MTKKQLYSINKIMNAQQCHWAFFPIVYLFMLIVPVNPIHPGVPMLIWFTLGCFPYMFSVVKSATNNTGIFWGIHLIALVYTIVLPVPHQVCKIAYVGCTFLYCVYSIFFKYSGEEEFGKTIPLYVSFGITFVMLLLLQYYHMYEQQRFFVNIFVVNVFVYCLTKYVENYCEFLRVNKYSVGYMPVKKIFYSGMGGMAIFASVMSMILLVVANLGEMNDAVNSFLRFCGNIVREIKLQFRQGKSEEYSVMEEAGGEVSQYLSQESGEMAPIWDILATVVFLLIVVFVFYKIITLLPYILSFFKMPVEAEEEDLGVEDVHESTVEVEQLPRRSFKKMWEFLTPAQKIRRRYKKKVLDSKEFIVSKGKKDCMEWYTARECGIILDRPGMSELYEKARYSPYECTAEDVKRMKDACKNSNV